MANGVMSECRNDEGEIITGKKILRSNDFGTGRVNEWGESEINWKLLTNADADGFDLDNLEENGRYKIEVRLPYGTILIRYGNETGRFTAPQFTQYEKLSLPYVKDTVEYNEYRVIADNIKLICCVVKGRAAAGFDCPGGAVQYLHPMTIRQSLRENILERISWTEKYGR